MTPTTYLGSGDASRHRRDYRPEWLDNLADDVTIEGSVLTGIVEGPEAIRAILGFARQLYDYQEFNYVGRYGDDGFARVSYMIRSAAPRQHRQTHHPPGRAMHQPSTDAGLTMFEVQQRVSHKDPTLTARVYTHLMRERFDEGRQRLEGYMTDNRRPLR